MKRLFILILTLLLTAALSGCITHWPPEVPTEAPTEAPTGAPYLDAQIYEPEWTLAAGELRLEDDDLIYAEDDDILYFAIVENEDGSRELRFRMDEITANMLTQQDRHNSYYITFNGERIGDAEISADGTIATVTAKNAEDEITALATKIRGLE